MTTTTDEEGRFACLPDESIPGQWEISIEDEEQTHADYWTVPVGSQGIIVNGMVLDDTRDIHYAAASAADPLLTTIGVSLVGLVFRTRRRPLSVV